MVWCHESWLVTTLRYWRTSKVSCRCVDVNCSNRKCRCVEDHCLADLLSKGRAQGCWAGTWAWTGAFTTTIYILQTLSVMIHRHNHNHHHHYLHHHQKVAAGPLEEPKFYANHPGRWRPVQEYYQYLPPVPVLESTPVLANECLYIWMYPHV